MKSTFRLIARSALALVSACFAPPIQAETIFEPIYQFETGSGPQPILARAADGTFFGTTETGGASANGTVFKLPPGGVLTTILSFNGLNGSTPKTGLVAGSDGNFYGATYGSPSGYGTVFRITPTGVLTTLGAFDGSNGSAAGRVVRTSDGSIYGVTEGGGTSGDGTFFKIPPGGVLTTLSSFTGVDGNGNRPADLVQGSDGNFYGISSAGGANSNGMAFKVTPTGTITKLQNFSLEVGAFPGLGFILATDGKFYGAAGDGGSFGRGTIFQMTSAGALSAVFEFGNSGSPTGPTRPSGIAQGADGNFYGTTFSGGDVNRGSVFRMTPGGSLTMLGSFNGSNGQFPRSAPARGTDGAFYGVAENSIYRFTTSGALTKVAAFDSPKGIYPKGGLIQAPDGNFYGTTRGGGANGLGTAYKVTPTGLLTSLASLDAPGGSLTYAGLVRGTDGNFYGTAPEGGPSSLGTLFRVTPAGLLTPLVFFNGANGGIPLSTLVRGSDGSFYGSTYRGGTVDEGTIFKVTASGGLTTLVSLTAATGRYPRAPLLLGSDGNFYGTTSGGGDNHQGTVFKMTPGGALSVLASLPPDSTFDSYSPLGGLVQGLDGSLYGTTFFGGTDNLGTVFKVTLTGTLTTLVSFHGNDGRYPLASMVRGSDGNLYGTTNAGGPYFQGTVFKVTPAGVLTSLYTFDPSIASSPSELIFGADGKLYGTADSIIYRLTLDTATLPPTLTAPAANSTAGSPLNVSFSLPESALAGTVKLVFDDGVAPRSLTLATPQETAGAHQFLFDPASPAASPAIASGSPIPNGTYAVHLSYQDALRNAAATSTVSLNVRLEASQLSFASWQAGAFNSAELSDPAMSGPGADPDGDGLVNMLEYALALRPRTPDAGALPSGALQEIAGTNYLTLTFRRRSGVGDLAYTPQTADSPTGPWPANAIQIGPATPHADGTETVTFRDALPVGSGKRFMRLQVTLSP